MVVEGSKIIGFVSILYQNPQVSLKYHKNYRELRHEFPHRAEGITIQQIRVEPRYCTTDCDPLRIRLILRLLRHVLIDNKNRKDECSFLQWVIVLE